MNLAESIHGLMLDWKRFTTYNAVDFMKVEIDAVKKYTPNIPVTTNFMGTFEPLNYWQFAKELDLVSWDSYPQWHVTGEGTTLQEYDIDLSHQIAFQHDLMRSYKKKRFILKYMELQ